MKLEKISKIALYASIAVGAVCFLLFYLVDYNNFDFDGTHVSPLMTDLLLVLMYIFFFVTAGLTIWSMVHGAKLNSGNTGPNPTGIPSGKVLLGTWGSFVAAIIIGAVTGIGEEAVTTTSGATTSGFMVGVVQMFLIAIYILAFLTIVATIVSMSGCMVKSATPKQ